jgi:activator of HSP90 ATPase
MPHTIHQEVALDADRARVYEALTDAGQFGELTGASPVTLTDEPGARFELFGGHIVGRNVELVPERRLVQAWRATPWPDGVYSLVSFRLEEGSDDSTKLVFDHTGFPEEAHDDLAAGWEKMYWEPLKRYLS